MKILLKLLSVGVLVVLVISSFTLLALAESSDEGDVFLGDDGVRQTPDRIGMLAVIGVVTTTDVLGDGECSLRGAILSASTDSSVDSCSLVGGGDDLINLPAGTYTLDGELEITSTLTISGAGAGSVIIDGNANGRVFNISSSTAVVTITDVTITSGDNVSQGGGILNKGTLVLNDAVVTGNTADDEGGGIYNENGTVTLNNSVVSLNTASGGATAGFGGGISNAARGGDATLTLNNSTVTTNTINGLGGGGINNSSGGSNSTATMVLNQSFISGNTATSTPVISTTGYGGGIRNGFYTGASDSTISILTVNNSTISNNQATNGGGLGSGTIEISRPAMVTVNDSTISDNTAAGSGDTVGNGGGVVNLNGTMEIINSTVSGNAANGTGSLTSGVGGGIGNGGFDAVATMWLTNTTIANNTAVFTGTGVAGLSFPGNSAVANFKNTIIAGNCFDGFGTGTFTSLDYNLEYNSVGSNTCNLTNTNDVTGSNPLLAPLADNGGDTHTHELLKNSAAIDAAGTCSGAPATDQRGESRPGTGSSVCDIGAFELQGTDLSLTKSATDSTLSGVTTITYTITVDNLVADPVTGVVVSDTLPSDVNFVSTDGTYNSVTGLWDVGGVAGSGSVSLEIVATTTLTGQTVVNTATINALNEVDLISSNDTDSASTTLPASGSEPPDVYLPIVIKSS